MATAAVDLRALGEESYGQRIRRAREESGVDLRDAAEWISRYFPTSYRTVARLEGLTRPPADLTRRAVGFLALLAYGFEPMAFGLKDADLPRSLDPDAIRADALSRLAALRIGSSAAPPWHLLTPDEPYERLDERLEQARYGYAATL